MRACSPYLIVMSYQHADAVAGAYVTNATFTTVVKATGKVKHSFTRGNVNVELAELAIVPP